MTAPTTSATASNAKNAPPPRPYPFPVGVYDTLTQDYDETIALGATVAAWAAGKQAPKWNVSPTGWLRTLWLNLTMTIAGNNATPAFAENGPFSIIQTATLYDLGQQTIQQYNGYEIMLVNKFGGYYMIGDPRRDISYSVTTGSGASAGSFNMNLAIPFEVVARDSLGTVQNESKPGWSVQVYLGGPADVYSTQPTSTGTASLRMQGYTESYTEPAAAATNGRPFSQTPPLPGTLQNWNGENSAMPSGQTRYDLVNGVGFPIRNIIYYAVDNTGSRSGADSDWPDPATLQLGNVTLFTKSKQLWISRLGKDFGLTSVTPDTAMGRENGVFPVYFTRDFGLEAGAELRFKYLDTQVNSLLRFSGSFGAAVTFNALVNWLATPSRNRYALIAGGN